MKAKRLLMALFTIVFTTSTALAEIKSGSCGDNATYTLDTETGLLKIEGTGGMENYFWEGQVPWCSSRSSITKLEIADGITSIGYYAFYGCSGLTSVTIPNSVTSIGGNAFRGCSSLISPIMTDRYFIKLPENYKGEYTIPEGLDMIGSAFYGCSGLTSVTIPESVTSIGYDAFSGCSSLTSVTIPNSVKSIGSSAFYGCSGLTSVIIPNSVTSIGYDAFKDCSGLTSVTIPNSVTSIGYDAFSGCSGLTSVIIPESVTSMGGGAFAECSSLTSVSIPNSVASIGDNTFLKCSSLTSVIIPESVTSIGKNAFYYCSSLASVTIGNSVTSIGDQAFYHCSSLTSVTIPNSVTSIGSSAFSGCSSLTSVTIGNSVTSIDEYTFRGCTSLTSLIIGNSIVGIKQSVFRDFSSLSSLTIGKSVRYIEYESFYNCKLRNLRCMANTPPSIDKTSFSDQTKYHATLYVPNGTWEAYAYDSRWYQFINIREEITETEDVNLENVYTLMNSETMAYMVYDPVNDRLREVPSATNIDEGNINHSWMAAELEGKMYLYNMGAGRFVRPTANGFELVDKKTALNATNGQTGMLFQGNNQQWSLVKNDSMFPKDGVIDAIKGITPDSSSQSGEIYDLQGRRIQKPAKGLYIQNGKKMLMK